MCSDPTDVRAKDLIHVKLFHKNVYISFIAVDVVLFKTLLYFLRIDNPSSAAMPALEARDKAFFLNGQKVALLSGAVHYFRVVPEYWKDRLLKVKAAGLNCVETYVLGHFS